MHVHGFLSGEKLQIKCLNKRSWSSLESPYIQQADCRHLRKEFEEQADYCCILFWI